MLDDGIASDTSREQWALEVRVLDLYRHLDARLLDGDDGALELYRDKHAKFLRKGLGCLNAGFLGLDASRTWLCYWILHGLVLLERPFPAQPDRDSIITFLASCQDPEGGFGGGPYQLPHLAPTYAAVAALVTLGGPQALSVIDRPALMRFLLRMCIPPEQGGGMVMHDGGEVDVRGCYCALAACHMLNLDVQTLADCCGMVDFIRRCQSYEGGIGGEPGNEAHGGYTYCGLAALCLLDRCQALDIPSLGSWVAALQAPFEGGYAGRTNKLVDGCYSFWQGAVLPLLDRYAPSNARATDTRTEQRPDQDLSPETLAARALVHSLAVRLEAAEKLEAKAEAAYSSAVHAQNDAAVSNLQHAARTAQHASQRLREGLDRARSQVAAVAHGAAALVATGLPGAPAAGRDVAQGSVCAQSLQVWLLAACQELRGGMRDKPGKAPDYYHTCYCLAGLAVSQAWSGVVVGGPCNALPTVDLRCNVRADALADARAWFSGR
ncbi:hypothetical protein ACKKBF_B35885 [Auxenochlorella protothecoides x Auxenochlorella symbiontica]